MSDEQPGGKGAIRRGATGEDASARDWVGGEAPDEDPSAAPAAADEAGAADSGGDADADPASGAASDAASDAASASDADVDADSASDAGARSTAAPAFAPDAVSTPAPAPLRGRSGRTVTAQRLRPMPTRKGAAPPAAAPTPDTTPAAAPTPDTTPATTPATSPAATSTVATPDTEQAPRQVVRATGPPRRPSMLVQGLWPAALAAALLGASAFGLLPLAVAVLGVQVFLILGALALLDAPASGGAFLLATGTTVIGDVVVLADDGRVGGLAGAAGVGVVAALLHQLSRKGRSRVTESLADTFVVMVVSLSAACLLALRQVNGGEDVLLVGFAAAGAVLLAGRVGDRLAPRPMLAVGSTRGWPGLLLGLGAGVAAAVLAADLDGSDLPLRSAALIGLVVASTVATADLAVDLGAAELRAGWRDARRVAALRPTALLLPYAVLGPIALLAGRLVLA